jgi:hypothetical protein
MSDWSHDAKLKGYHMDDEERELVKENHGIVQGNYKASERQFNEFESATRLKTLGQHTLSYDAKWRHRNIKSVRLSESLLAMIQAECERRKIKFSEFIRFAATAVLRHRHPPPSDHAEM